MTNNCISFEVKQHNAMLPDYKNTLFTNMLTGLNLLIRANIIEDPLCLGANR